MSHSLSFLSKPTDHLLNNRCVYTVSSSPLPTHRAKLSPGPQCNCICKEAFMGVTKARLVDKDGALIHWAGKRKTEEHRGKVTSGCKDTKWQFTHTSGIKVFRDASLGIWILNF